MAKGATCGYLRRICNAALVLQLGVLGQASNSQVARVSRAVSRRRGSSKEGGMFVGLLAAPLAWRHRCHKLGTHPAGSNSIARPTPPVAACSPKGSSALSATGPESEPPEEVQYGFWAPASKELHRDHWAPPASKKARFGSPSHSASGRLGGLLVSRGQPYNVVLTHLSADFDSLAAAVGVAKLWNAEDRKASVPTYVVLPRGAHPSVSKFLALHQELFPILGLELLDPTGARKVGMCDAQTRDRVGPASELLDQAESVHVYDHHVDKDSDIVDAVLHIESVGAATTVVTEMIRSGLEQGAGIGVQLTEAESTLLALGIHADTAGSLTYDSATARDAAALAWLMMQGCQQTVVSEYTHTSLSEGQQSSLVEAFGSLEKRQHNGVSVGSVLLVNEERVAGMARVAQNLLDMSEVGVLLVGEMHPSKPGRAKDRLALIGRVISSVESVDFNTLFKRQSGSVLARVHGVCRRGDLL
ncbi:unnamed protein product [Ectocarpus sp. 6 AP-2014]